MQSRGDLVVHCGQHKLQRVMYFWIENVLSDTALGRLTGLAVVFILLLLLLLLLLLQTRRYGDVTTATDRSIAAVSYGS